MSYTRRQFLKNAATASALLATGCVSPHGHKASYTSRILKPQNQNPVFHWTDAALQQVRDQRATPPLAAYCCSLPMAAGFLAANGILQAYEEPFGIGTGPRGANPEVAYGVAFASAAAEAFQQPFLFERMAFLDRFPAGEAKSLGVRWGRAGRPQGAQECGRTTAPSPASPVIIWDATSGARIRCVGRPPVRSTGRTRVLRSPLSIAACFRDTGESNPGP